MWRLFFFFFFKLAKFVGQIPSVADINASVRGSSCQWFLEPVCWLFISHWGAEQQTVVTNVKLLDQWTQSRRFTTIRFHIRADRSGSDTEIVMDLFVTLIFNFCCRLFVEFINSFFSYSCPVPGLFFHTWPWSWFSFSSSVYSRFVFFW